MQKGDRYTHRFKITLEVYNGFIEVFKDKNLIHTDEHFAKEKGFKSIVMHGNILNGFLSYFIGECLPEKNVMIYSQSIDFKKPVFLNDSLTLYAHIEDIYESVKSAEIKFYFNNSDGVKVTTGKVLVGINL
ncbi:MAG TPA: MaoC/PaaZ C-terminal domain-containing protein [Bacteroidia bacterium]|jgi:3-hydroxybutyryl-CoA dehydratase|nr:MaoC/PaaZ C-terminal domain-containing protein [Bacteroidia bacterium]